MKGTRKIPGSQAIAPRTVWGLWSQQDIGGAIILKRTGLETTRGGKVLGGRVANRLKRDGKGRSQIEFYLLRIKSEKKQHSGERSPVSLRERENDTRGRGVQD